MATAVGPVGVLAVQGDFAAHRRAVERAGLGALEVRRPAQLAGLSALILPGGESTTMLKFLAEEGLGPAILGFARSGRPILATCAGVVLAARGVSNPAQDSLGLLDVDVTRNGFGRQVHSAIHRLEAPEPLGSLEAVFIRAPRITRVGPGVEVLARLAGEPVLVRQGAVLAATFHPELSPGSPIHGWFLAGTARAQNMPPSTLSTWPLT